MHIYIYYCNQKAAANLHVTGKLANLQVGLTVNGHAILTEFIRGKITN